jgi:hypothetical protein
MCNQRYCDPIAVEVSGTNEDAVQRFRSSDPTGRAVATDGNQFARATGARITYALSTIIVLRISVDNAPAPVKGG